MESKFKSNENEVLTIAGMKENIRYILKGLKDPSKPLRCNNFSKEKTINIGDNIKLDFSYLSPNTSGGGFDHLCLFSFHTTNGNPNNKTLYFESLEEAEEIISNLILELDEAYYQNRIKELDDEIKVIRKILVDNFFSNFNGALDYAIPRTD